MYIHIYIYTYLYTCILNSFTTKLAGATPSASDEAWECGPANQKDVPADPSELGFMGSCEGLFPMGP